MLPSGVPSHAGTLRWWRGPVVTAKPTLLPVLPVLCSGCAVPCLVVQWSTAATAKLPHTLAVRPFQLDF